MTIVEPGKRTEFFRAVESASKAAIWCAVATVVGNEARVRMVHPTWEGETLWFATGTGSPKHQQIEANGNVDIQFQVAPPDFIHIMVRGTAESIANEAEKKRVWDVIDYDLAEFWPGGPTDPNYTLIRVTPSRVELSKMFGSMDKQVWRA